MGHVASHEAARANGEQATTGRLSASRRCLAFRYGTCRGHGSAQDLLTSARVQTELQKEIIA